MPVAALPARKAYFDLHRFMPRFRHVIGQGTEDCIPRRRATTLRKWRSAALAAVVVPKRSMRELIRLACERAKGAYLNTTGK